MNSNPFEAIDARLQSIEHGIKELAKQPKEEPPTREKFLTVDQVCEILSVSRVTLWSWDRKGILNPVRVGNLKRYRLSEIESLGENTGKNKEKEKLVV
jgi:excisionase family DNA binding protein